MCSQHHANHPLMKFGWCRPPHWLWRRSQSLYVAAMAIHDIWLIARGKLTLHRAYQEGYETGSRNEYHRTVVMGGR